MTKSIPDLILEILKGSGSKLSTYEIAKRVGISWSTASIHCYKLKSEHKISGKLETAHVGSGKKMLWRARKTLCEG